MFKQGQEDSGRMCEKMSCKCLGRILKEQYSGTCGGTSNMGLRV